MKMMLMLMLMILPLSCGVFLPFHVYSHLSNLLLAVHSKFGMLLCCCFCCCLAWDAYIYYKHVSAGESVKLLTFELCLCPIPSDPLPLSLLNPPILIYSP